MLKSIIHAYVQAAHSLWFLFFPPLFIPNVHFTDDTEDEDMKKEYIEETNRDAVMIAAAKLVASDTVSKVSTSVVR